MKRRLWTKEEIEELRKVYPDSRMEDLIVRFGRSATKIYAAAKRYRVKKSSQFYESGLGYRLGPGTRIGARNWFTKGHVPANKGTRRPGWSTGRMRETQFKKGHRSHNYLPIGTVRTDYYGYVRIKIADGLGGDGNQKAWAFLHKVVWEKAHGPIPKGHRIWWKDRNHQNCALENLELISDAEHMARTSLHNLPEDLKHAIVLNGALKRRIRRLESHGQKQNFRPAASSLRNAGAT